MVTEDTKTQPNSICPRMNIYFLEVLNSLLKAFSNWPPFVKQINDNAILVNETYNVNIFTMHAIISILLLVESKSTILNGNFNDDDTYSTGWCTTATF